jgi:tetrahydromethanopterin S-methyltransferase subunit C
MTHDHISLGGIKLTHPVINSSLTQTETQGRTLGLSNEYGK